MNRLLYFVCFYGLFISVIYILTRTLERTREVQARLTSMIIKLSYLIALREDTTEFGSFLSSRESVNHKPSFTSD